MKNKVIIITGGSRGIGTGISTAFLEKGARIVINYRSNEEAALKFKQELGDDENVLLVQADIGVTKDRQHLIDETIKHFGRIDVLVNNAGIAARKKFLKGTEDEFDSIMNTNLKGPVFLAQAYAQHMIDHNIKGSIINISSVSGHFPNAPASYCASKAGLILATKRMALELAPHDIRANVVTPGSIKSDMNRRHWHDNPELWQETIKHYPMQRGGEPKELASAVVYLASDEASYTTGTEIIVDGGWSLKPYWS